MRSLKATNDRAEYARLLLLLTAQTARLPDLLDYTITRLTREISAAGPVLRPEFHGHLVADLRQALSETTEHLASLQAIVDALEVVDQADAAHEDMSTTTDGALLTAQQEGWTSGEPGPTCPCGKPTAVIFTAAGLPALLCFAHTEEESALYSLPREKPEKWPALTTEEMQALIARGDQEHEATDGGAA